MRLFYSALIVIICLVACTSTSQNTDTSSIFCEMYNKITLITTDDLSAKELIEWIGNEFSNVNIEAFTDSEPYDYSVIWKEKNIDYYAHYTDGVLLNIMVVIKEGKPSASDVIECLGEPTNHGASRVLDQLSIGLAYPSKGVHVIGIVRNSAEFPRYDDPIITTLYLVRPTNNIEDFYSDVFPLENPFGESDEPREPVKPWAGWDAIEVYDPTLFYLTPSPS